MSLGEQIFTGKVIAQLREGFGAEDIALSLGVKAERVRAEIARLRETGAIKKLYGKEMP